MSLLPDDETKARPRELGPFIELVIAHLALAGLNPAPQQIMDAVSLCAPQYGPNEARAHKQNAAGAVNKYFDCLLPPAGWIFHGHHIHLGPGRVQLMWQHQDGQLLLDVVNTGRPELLWSRPVQASTRVALAEASATCGKRLLGLRLLSPAGARQSQLHTRSAPPVALDTTPYFATRSQ